MSVHRGTATDMDANGSAAFYACLTEAKAGDATSMRKVAEFFANGKGVDKDDNEAGRWFLKAAEAGDVEANYILGQWITAGRSFEKDDREAAKYFHAADKAGHKQASLVVAEWVAAGHIFDQNIEVGTKIYHRISGIDKLSEAANGLGVRFYNGSAFIKSHSVARKLYRYGSDLGSPYATGNYAGLLDDGEGGPHEPGLAVEFHRKAADMGNPHSLRMLAHFHDVGRRVEVDADLALELVQRASSKGSACATYDLARAHHFGLINGVDLDQAEKHYKRAVEGGCSCARRYLPRIAFERDGQISAPAITAKFGDDTSYCVHLLAGTFLFGTGIDRERDVDRALRLASIFAQRNLRKCQHRLIAERFVSEILKDDAFLRSLSAALISNDISTPDGIQTILKILANDSNASWTQIECLFSAYRHVCWEFGWVPLEYAAKQAAAIAATYAIGRSIDEVSAAQQNVGFVFNRLSSDGFLIPYYYDDNHQPRAQTSIDRLRAVHLTTNNENMISEVSLVGSMDADAVPLVTDDDLLVALALAFDDSPQLPSLSIESIEHDAIDGRTTSLRRKKFSPRWVGATDFGRALYYADWLMCNGYGATVSLTKPFSWPDMSISRMNGAIYDSIVDAHFGKLADSGRVMLHLVHVDYTSEKRRGFFKEEEVWWINGVNFRVDGSGITYLDDGTEDRLFGLNDPDFQNAHSGLIHTNRYESLCAAYPVFARVRELFTLMRIIMDIRISGYTLSHGLKKKADATRSRAASASAGKDEIIVSW